YAIKGCDTIVAKNKLWELLADYYGRERASQLAPNTYILTSQDDRIRLLGENPDKIFIAKKNVQRQEGLKLILKKDLDIKMVNQLVAEKYVIIQEYLDKPFTINDRKINMRVYLLLVIKQDVLAAYVYDDGFIYYAKDKYK